MEGQEDQIQWWVSSIWWIKCAEDIEVVEEEEWTHLEVEVEECQEEEETIHMEVHNSRQSALEPK